MSSLRELDQDEIAGVSGSAGTPTLTQMGAVQGATVWGMSCGSGFNIVQVGGVNWTNTSNWNNPNDYSCTNSHPGGVNAYNWFEPNGGSQSSWFGYSPVS